MTGGRYTVNQSTKARAFLALPASVVIAWMATLSAFLVGCLGSPTDGTDPLNGEPPPEDPPPIVSSCQDKDGDGFGTGCGNGADCNEEDPTITNQCYGCAGSTTGCPCATEGKKVPCGQAALDAQGTPSCWFGEKTCTGGVWSACLPTSTPGGLRPMDLSTGSTACPNNPCDPACQHFPDTPDPSLSNPDAGLVATEAGLSISPTEIDAGAPTTCANQTAQAQPVPLDMYIMLDKSGSMSWGGRWTAVKSALTTFVNDSSSAGVTVALDYFPGSPECEISTYSTPSVNWTLLPGGASAIVNSLNSTYPDGYTPTRPALLGAGDAARARATAYPSHKVVIVLATDGEPNVCESTLAATAAAAAAAYNGTPSVPVYVIGIGNVSNLNTIAAAGMPGQTAFITTGGDASSFLTAMRAIRNQALGCDYTLPVPPTGNIAPESTEVSYKLGTTGTPTSVPLKNTAADCGSGNGFYYDNAAHPTKLTLCPATCNTVKSNVNYNVDLTFKCSASCGSSSNAVTPIPLDMMVMVDKSGSMSWDSPTRWSAVTSALKTFVDSPSSSGVTMALDYFPQSPECSPSTYSTPSVAWTLLPGGATAIKNSLNTTSPDGGTPTRPALQGAIDYARVRAMAYPDHKVVVVLATDGEPNNCSSTVQTVADVASLGYVGGSISTATVTSVSETYENVTSTGTSCNVQGQDDVVRGPYNIGFPFSFYGQTYNQFWVDTNGYISLVDPNGSHWSNAGIPISASPNGIIAAFWDDLVVGGNIYYQMLGTSPNRHLVVQWTSARRIGYTGNINFEIVLWENGNISLRYGAKSGNGSDGQSATVGVENAGGTVGHQYSMNAGLLGDNTTLRYTFSAQTYPSIVTYVIGVGYAGALDQIAAAGGSGQAYIVTGGNAAEFLAAMNAIRNSSLGCAYAIPPSSLGTVNPNQLTVRYTPGTGTPVDFPLRPGPANCGSLQGFYYDDPVNPTTVTLCPASCAMVSSDPQAQLSIFYDCLGAYVLGTFVRDYAAGNLCPPGKSHVWGNWSWQAQTPSNSSIDFRVAVADSITGLATAPEYPLRFTNPPGPASLVNTNIGARAGTPDTQSGAAKVDTTLALENLNRKSQYLRVKAILRGGPPNYTESPLLQHWDQQITCEDSE